MKLLNKRGPEKTCWPSEIPRIAMKIPKDSWDEFSKEYMIDTRRNAIILFKQGKLDILQKMRVLNEVQVQEIRGPIRLRIRSVPDVTGIKSDPQPV